MFKEGEFTLPLYLTDQDFDCQEDCPAFNEALDATMKGANEAGMTIEEYKAQIRSLEFIEKAEVRSISQQVAKTEGVFSLCRNHKLAKFGIGFDQ